MTNPQRISNVANSLWNKTFPNGKLIISDEPSERKHNFGVLCNLKNKEGIKLSDVLSNDEIGEILNEIQTLRVSSRVGALDF